MNRIVKLSEVCDFLDNQRIPIEESLRKPGKYPYYGANGVQDWIDGYIFDEPLILLAEDGGHFGSKTLPIAYKITGKSWVNNHAHVLRPKNNCDIDFLVFILAYYDVSSIISGTTRPKLTKGNAESISFYLPPLPEQQRIAAILQKADRIRQLRRYARQLSDGYLQSVFLERLGEQIRTQGDIDRFGRVIQSTQNGFSPRVDFDNSGTIVLRIRDISSGIIDYSTPRRMIIDASKIKKYALHSHDLILVRVNGNPNLVGISSVFEAQNEPIVFSDHIIRVKLNEKVLNPIFAAFVLNSPYGRNETLKNITTTAGQYTINSSGLSQIRMIYPSMEKQNEFVKLMDRFNNLLKSQHESERQAEQLFQSLLHKAFEGEL